MKERVWKPDRDHTDRVWKKSRIKGFISLLDTHTGQTPSCERKHVLITKNVGSTVLRIKGDGEKTKKVPSSGGPCVSTLCPFWLLFWYWDGDLVTVFLLVVMFTWWWVWLMDVLYGMLAPVTQRSVPSLEEHTRNQLKTVKVISDMGSGSTSYWCMSAGALCLPRQAFPDVSVQWRESSFIDKIKNLITE